MRVFLILPLLFNGVFSAPKPKKVNWSPCFQAFEEVFGGPFLCSVVNAPLDYTLEKGPSVSLSVLRVPARGTKIGSIFLNPGGPGGSGVTFAIVLGLLADVYWGPEIRNSFDLIGFDPRGIERSTQLKCFGNLNQALEILPPFDFPLTPEEEELVEDLDALLIGQCDKRGNKIGEHMSTANVARDMDFIREALGEEKMNFVGLSYGSYVGVVYANMFPDKVRALVVDGVLNPEAWLNLEGVIPSTTRLQSFKGAQDSLERFFELCSQAAEGNCALNDDDSKTPKERFEALAEQLLTEEEPRIAIIFGEPFPVDYSFLIGLTLGGLYDKFNFPDLAQFIVNIEAGAPLDVIQPAAEAILGNFGFGSKRNFPKYFNLEGFQGVLCSDSNNPTDYEAWSVAGATADEDSYFGRIWTWASSACSGWPFEDASRYEGDFKANTANPVLVIGNLYDPATPYEGAVAADGLLGNSFLVEVDTSAHCALGANLCADAITAQYLLNPELAAADYGPFTQCPEDLFTENIFDFLAAPPPEPEQLTNSALRAQLLSHIAFSPFVLFPAGYGAY